MSCLPPERRLISSREVRNDHHVQLRALKNRGAITIVFGERTRNALIPDVALAFNVSDEAAV